MISFQQSVETFFTGIFGCGRGCNNTDFSGLDESKENQDDVMNHLNESEKYSNSKRMIPSDKNASFLNETGTTCQDSFFDESCSSFIDRNNDDRGLARIPLQPRQEPPQVQIRERELMAIPSNGAMESWSPVMPLPMLADPVFVSKKEQQQLPVSPVRPPKIQRLTLDDAPALPHHTPHHHHINRTQMPLANTTSSHGMMYDIDGLPMNVPEPFSRSRSLDFLFSFSSPSFLKENGRNRCLYTVKDIRDHHRDAYHTYYPSHCHYQQRGMVENTSTYQYPYKSRKQEEKVLSDLNNTYMAI